MEKVLSVSQRKRRNISNLLPDCSLDVQENNVLPGAQCWSLLLADLLLSSKDYKVILPTGSPCCQTHV